MVAEIEAVNRTLLAARRPYVLLGFGRWGTTDARHGVPVAWGQISGAKAIVESFLPGIESEPSQASHFFHNVVGAGVFYFTVPRTGSQRVRWDRLDRLPAAGETAFLRHVELSRPLRVAVDGRTGRGLIAFAEDHAAAGGSEVTGS
jgi:hypothetical protein